MNTAQAWAIKNNKVTLEQTAGGKTLTDLELFENPVFDNAQAAKLWNMASNKFASGASGVTQGFTTGAQRIGPYGERTWWRIEKPILEGNDDVSAMLRLKKDGAQSVFGSFFK